MHEEKNDSIKRRNREIKKNNWRFKNFSLSSYLNKQSK